MNLKDLQYLKYINDIKFIALALIIAATAYLLIKSPKIKYTTEIQLEKKLDTLKIDTNATISK